MKRTDLRFNYPLLPGQARILVETSNKFHDERTLKINAYPGDPADRQAAARWLSRFGRRLAYEEVFICSGGQHAVLVSLLAAGLPGRAMAVERLTYPGLKDLAALLGITLVPCDMDNLGLVPDSLAEACRRRGASALYCMPTVHNPIGAVMPIDRRREIAAIAREYGLWLIEDDAYGFLEDAAPPNFSVVLPERSFYVFSLSKPFAPGIKIACLVAPGELTERTARSIAATTSGAAPLFARCVASWMDDGTLDDLITAKRAEGARRQAIAREILKGVEFDSHPHSYHIWTRLPGNVPALSVVALLNREGLEVSPAEAFAADAEAPPNAFRISLGGEDDMSVVAMGIRRLVEVLGSVGN